MFERVTQSIRGIREGNAFHRVHGPHAPRAGDMAPDFELGDAKGASTVRLSQYQGQRPVALVVGSFT